MRHARVLSRLALAAVTGLALGGGAVGPSPAAADEHHGVGLRRGVPFALPDVTGLPSDAAERRLRAAGLTTRRETIAHDLVGRAVGTLPAAGTWLAPGSEVVLRVGVAPRVMTITPDLGRGSAEALLAGLEEVYALDIVPVRGPLRLDGRVRRQTPEAGTLLPFRGLLRVEVVAAHTEVPFVEGLPLRAARELIEAAGLTLDIHVDARADARRGTVVGQVPEGRAAVPLDTLVHLTVATRAGGFFVGGPPGAGGPGRGLGGGRWADAWGDLEDDTIVESRPSPRPTLVVMPDVRGQRRDEAVARLEALGLLVEGGAERGQRFEVVTRQSPVAGTRVAPGTRILIESVYARPGPGPGGPR